MNDYISKPVQPALLLSKLAGIAVSDVAAAPGIVPPPVQTNDNAKANGPLDLDKLSELQAALPLSVLTSLISLYLIEADEHVARIAECRAQDDFEEISRQAHTLVSIAGNLGAMQTSAAARRLETACRSGDFELSRRLIGELDKSFEVSSAALRAWSDGRASDFKSAAAS